METLSLLTAWAVMPSGVASVQAGTATAVSGNLPRYKDKQLPFDQRVADLLARMTLEEKVGQLLNVLGWEMYEKTGDRIGPSGSFKRLLKERQVGSLYGVLRADPWTRVTLKTGLSPRQSAEAINALQRYTIENTRLGIPLLIAEECTHGHMAIGATVFSTAIGQASTFNPDLIRKMGSAIAHETRTAGGNVAYGPILDLAREPRWSRVEETYGEDPVLCGQMGVAMVEGFQAAGLNTPGAVLATLKHFAAYGQPEGGHNGGPVHVGQRELHSMLLPPFKAAVQAGAGSVMSSYNEIDGVPCTADKSLLTTVLRDQWKFRGFVVSDLDGIPALAQAHHTAATTTHAAGLAVNAGVDADLGGSAYTKLLEAIEEGLVSQETLDRAVSRVLLAKFKLGLFENPYSEPARAERVVGSSEHRQLAREVARQSIILLKNADGLLPLDKNVPAVAVIGPNANNVYNQLGDYTAPQADGAVVTVLEGIRKKVSSQTTVRFAKGCAIRGSSKDGFAEALDAVQQSSVAIVVLGGSSARDFGTQFENTGAARPPIDADGSDMESGEGFDRATLDLAGVQLDLLQQIVRTGKPVVLVLIKGRPLLLNWPAQHVPAIVDAWYPGQEGGNAIADVLFGDYNPAGRLPVSVPRSVGQLPVFYNRNASQRNDYMDEVALPLFPFGHGLSYTQFSYANLQVAVQENANDVAVNVTAEITNTGTRSGDEVVQLYLCDVVSSVTTPLKALKAFRRVSIRPAETQTVRFTLGSEEMALLNQEMRWVVEPGRYEVMLGSSSEDTRLRSQFDIAQPITL